MNEWKGAFDCRHFGAREHCNSTIALEVSPQKRVCYATPLAEVEHKAWIFLHHLCNNPKTELQRSTKEEASVLTMPVCDVMMACQVSRYSCTYWHSTVFLHDSWVCRYQQVKVKNLPFCLLVFVYHVLRLHAVVYAANQEILCRVRMKETWDFLSSINSLVTFIWSPFVGHAFRSDGRVEIVKGRGSVESAHKMLNHGVARYKFLVFMCNLKGMSNWIRRWVQTKIEKCIVVG